MKNIAYINRERGEDNGYIDTLFLWCTIQLKK
jgi:hypothetical protein